VVVGNPGRLIRKRFSDAAIELILESRWWELTIEEVAKAMGAMVQGLGDDPWRHPLLAGAQAERCGK
jgi:hypothetical protein